MIYGEKFYSKTADELPVNIFLIVIGLSPYGESLPPSRLNPSPAPSFLRVTVMGGPRGTSTNFRSEDDKVGGEPPANLQLTPPL